MHAERCPVCLAKVDPACPGCSGKGWVEVSDGGYRYVPYVAPYTYPWPANPYPWQPMTYPYIYTTTPTFTSICSGGSVSLGHP